jgi:hypothetical protein
MRKAKLYDKVRTERDTIEERDAKRGLLKDYQSGRTAEMMWGWNDSVERDQIFKIRVGQTTFMLDKEEVMKFLRWI